MNESNPSENEAKGPPVCYINSKEDALNPQSVSHSSSGGSQPPSSSITLNTKKIEFLPQNENNNLSPIFQDEQSSVQQEKEKKHAQDQEKVKLLLSIPISRFKELENITMSGRCFEAANELDSISASITLEDYVDEPRDHYSAGLVFYRVYRNPDAAKPLTKMTKSAKYYIIKLYPAEFRAAYNMLAQIHTSNEDFPNALVCLKKVREIMEKYTIPDSDYAEAWNYENVAMYFWKKIKFDKARKDFAEAENDKKLAEIGFIISKYYRMKVPNSPLKNRLLININVKFAQFLIECGKLKRAKKLNNEALSLLKNEHGSYDMKAKYGQK